MVKKKDVEATLSNDDLKCSNCGHDLADDVRDLLARARAHLEMVERLGVFVASSSNRGLKHFHRLTCKWAAEIPSRNVIIFSSHDDAVEKGYRVCKTCCP